MKLNLIAGHTQGAGEGAQNLQTKETENQIARKIILDLSLKIADKIEYNFCEFSKALDEKITWINRRSKNEDITLSLHLDSSQSRKEEGAMMYYYGGSEESKVRAEKFLQAYCEATGLKNNGVRPDTSSRFGRLGIVRDTVGFAFLLELGSINNDLETVKEKAVAGIMAGIATLGFEEKIFTDVDTAHPYYKACKWAKENGIASGYTDGSLGVDENLTVGRFLEFLRKYSERR